MYKNKYLSKLIIAGAIAITASGCNPIVSGLIPDPEILKADCPTCPAAPSDIFRDPADQSGTLFTGLSAIQAEIAAGSFPADIRPYFFHGRGVDMNGNLIKQYNVFWAFAFVSDNTRTLYEWSMASDGSMSDVHESTYDNEIDYRANIRFMANLFNVTPFDGGVNALSLGALITDGLNDSPQVMTAVSNDPAYVPSGFGFGLEVNDPFSRGEEIPLGAYYAASLSAPAYDVATSVIYGESNVEVSIINEALWNIVDFPADHSTWGGRPQADWIDEYYGVVSRPNYATALQKFNEQSFPGSNPSARYDKLDGNGALLSGAALDHSCVLDSVTGLTWEVKNYDQNSPFFVLNTYTWYDANPATNGGNAGAQTHVDAECAAAIGDCNTANYVAYVNSVNLCGYNDWRVPAPSELGGLIMSSYFPSLMIASWSSATSATDNNQAVAYYFLIDDTAEFNKSEPGPVMLVR